MKKVKSFFTETIKDIDLFGHPIELNFNKKGSTHNTFIGGFLSIFIRFGLLVYVTVIFYKMFSYGNNIERSSTFTLVMDHDKAEGEAVKDVHYSDLHSSLFIVVRW